MRSLFAGAIACVLTAQITAAGERFAAKTFTLEGWTVHVRESLYVDEPEATEKAIKLLTEQLKLVTKMVPAAVLPELQSVPLYVSPAPHGERMHAAYHPSIKWLKDHDRNPEMAKAVEFTNVPIFEKEIKRMPVMALHELAHAYHDRVLGFDHPEIKAAYEAAVAAKSYDSVPLRSNGKKVRSYAMTNHKEYFAETTEAYFGTNDIYPFTREELRAHDPRMLKLLENLWRVKSITP